MAFALLVALFVVLSSLLLASGAPLGDSATSSSSTSLLSAKDFCGRYGLESGCLWKMAAGLGVLFIYALFLLAFVCGGCADRGWCVVIK
ncbi:hypothetical protein QR680_017189 [Steinernema hermaphroditum]|uniref:Uncharacterized protein n=1 Tax=Steinernema hermaphroditum TaxID=289476 RepID=A0AA39HDM9_9BILA|nr:hypothetical protein QR680_017189 [Steinernema hermaphroditum]